MHGRHRPCGGGADRLRPGRGRYRDLLERLLHDPRPDDAEPAGRRCRDAVPLGDLPPLPDQKAAEEDVIELAHTALPEPHRDRVQPLDRLLPRRGVPPGLLPPELGPALLPGGDLAEGGEVPPALCGAAEGRIEAC